MKSSGNFIHFNPLKRPNFNPLWYVPFTSWPPFEHSSSKMARLDMERPRSTARPRITSTRSTSTCASATCEAMSCSWKFLTPSTVHWREKRTDSSVVIRLRTELESIAKFAWRGASTFGMYVNLQCILLLSTAQGLLQFQLALRSLTLQDQTSLFCRKWPFSKGLSRHRRAYKGERGHREQPEAKTHVLMCGTPQILHLSEGKKIRLLVLRHRT